MRRRTIELVFIFRERSATWRDSGKNLARTWHEQNSFLSRQFRKKDSLSWNAWEDKFRDPFVSGTMLTFTSVYRSCSSFDSILHLVRWRWRWYVLWSLSISEDEFSQMKRLKNRSDLSLTIIGIEFSELPISALMVSQSFWVPWVSILILTSQKMWKKICVFYGSCFVTNKIFDITTKRSTTQIWKYFGKITIMIKKFYWSDKIIKFSDWYFCWAWTSMFRAKETCIKTYLVSKSNSLLSQKSWQSCANIYLYWNRKLRGLPHFYRDFVNLAQFSLKEHTKMTGTIQNTRETGFPL